MGQPYLNNLVSAVDAPAMSLSGGDGQIRARGAQGLYVQDLRALSRLEVTIDGGEPVPLGHELVGGNTNEFDAWVANTGTGVEPAVFVRRRRVVNRTGMVESVTVRSCAPAVYDCRVEMALASDLAGIAMVKAGRRPSPRPAQAVEDGLAWVIPDRCSVTATGSPHPGALAPSPSTLAWDVSIGPGQSITVSVTVELQEQSSTAPVVPAPQGRTYAPCVPNVVADDHRLGRFVELSLADLDRLRMAVPASPDDVFLAAGAPWYLTLFGRDSIWSARMLLPLGTDLALGTLRTLARYQGRSWDPRTGEQPGKILHEVRRQTTYNEVGELPGQTPPGLPPTYYGTVDATPLWVCLLHDAWKWGLPDDEVEPLLGPMQRCLAWLADAGMGADGFVRYIDESGRGLSNQGWKDSFDAIQFRDGALARAPIALCEVQGYTYAAATGGADLLEAFGLEGAERWRELAAALAESFRQRFWVEDSDGPYPAIALDRDGDPVGSLSSNIGHLLGTGILDGEENDAVARRLNSADLNCGFGLRTLAASSGGFNPVSYHRGSVWAHDTAIAVAGLSRTSGTEAQRAAVSLVEGLLGAAEAFDYRLPELYAGHDRAARRRPLPYPAACHPQAWAAASSIVVLTALLGIQADVPGGRVILAPLATPTGLKRVDGLCVGGEPVSIEIGANGEAKMTGGPLGMKVVAST